MHIQTQQPAAASNKRQVLVSHFLASCLGCEFERPPRQGVDLTTGSVDHTVLIKVTGSACHHGSMDVCCRGRLSNPGFQETRRVVRGQHLPPVRNKIGPLCLKLHDLAVFCALLHMLHVQGLAFGAWTQSFLCGWPAVMCQNLMQSKHTSSVQSCCQAIECCNCRCLPSESRCNRASVDGLLRCVRAQ